MNRESDITALIEMLEKVVTDCTLTDRTWSQLAQVEFLIRHVKSGQADQELIAALLAFNGSIAAQGKYRPRSTDSAEQGRAGLTARGMRLADSVFAQLSPAQKDKFSRDLAAHDASTRLTIGRQH
jgi:hypothetical protein